MASVPAPYLKTSGGNRRSSNSPFGWRLALALTISHNIIVSELFAHDNNNIMSVTLHTTLGPIKIEVFCDTAPRTAFNFLALCASGYYDNTVFHRNMKGFMIQGGDPTGTGKGGECIWGGKFEDEFHPDNTHHTRGQVSMANTGMNSNGSQVSSLLPA